MMREIDEKVVKDNVVKAVVLYFMHFGNMDPDLVTCRDCCDYKLGLCSGGAKDVFSCMYDIAERCEMFTNI